MKIAVLLSGGVDSSVALRLLKGEGHDLTAFYLKIWLEDELSFLGECPWEEDLNFARAVCDQANIPLEILSLQREYWDIIVSYAIRELKQGRTPNSDMFCNSLIKFGLFYDKIEGNFQKVGSGHYANLEFKEGKYLLKRAPDPIKDQTYFLAYLKQGQLGRACFPLGQYSKNQVRELAQLYNLPNKNRKDSQGICFLGQIRYADFVKYHLGEKPGDFIDMEANTVVGEHRGYWFYTIGQRQGLGLSGGPWYVVKKNIEMNIIYLSRNLMIRNQLNRSFHVEDINWIAGNAPLKKKLQVKIRHGENMHQCTVKYNGNQKFHVYLGTPDQGIAGGQFAVFYDGDICLGAGIISLKDKAEIQGDSR
jgi:tRNA (5-methylaminomethyl-2-thiouridylate)-methyltransferase